MKRLRSLGRDRAGGMVVDFALTATPLLILMFGTMELGRMLWLQNALNYSVEAAARCAAIDVNNCKTSDQIKSYAAASSGSGFTSGTFTVTTPACGKQVAASYPMSVDIPFGAVSITLTAQSCYPT
ncbi:MAG TPA: TadE family protein [Stellaceae bacterium]|nr:TadE family protein [Stellaceae bacterium]